MIEVLKDGRSKKFFAVCPDCYSELSYKREDTERKQVGRDYIGTPTFDNFIICPICGNQFAIVFQ